VTSASTLASTRPAASSVEARMVDEHRLDVVPGCAVLDGR
jgi:hypothetical protein